MPRSAQMQRATKNSHIRRFERRYQSGPREWIILSDKEYPPFDKPAASFSIWESEEFRVIHGSSE